MNGLNQLFALNGLNGCFVINLVSSFFCSKFALMWFQLCKSLDFDTIRFICMLNNIFFLHALSLRLRVFDIVKMLKICQIKQFLKMSMLMNNRIRTDKSDSVDGSSNQDIAKLQHRYCHLTSIYKVSSGSKTYQ